MKQFVSCVAYNGGSCCWALWAMPPQKNKVRERTMRLIYNSEKTVNCHIPACFTRHSGVRASITSHFRDLSLVRKHLKNDVIFRGKLDACLGISYLTCAIARIRSPIPTKEAPYWLKFIKFGQETVCPLWYNNNNDHNSSEM